MKIHGTEIKNLESIPSIAVPHLGEYAGIEAAFEKLVTWADANNLWVASPRLTGVYHDDPAYTPADKLRSKACLENLSGITPPEGMEDFTISGGKYFVMHVEITMSEYHEAWQKAYATFNEKGYGYDMREHYELYVTCCNPEDASATSLVDICIPMK